MHFSNYPLIYPFNILQKGVSYFIFWLKKDGNLWTDPKVQNDDKEWTKTVLFIIAKGADFMLIFFIYESAWLDATHEGCCKTSGALSLTGHYIIIAFTSIAYRGGTFFSVIIFIIMAPPRPL